MTTYNVASPYGPTQAQAAIDSASDGDVVAFPACNVTWSSGVTISGKGIKVQGAGGGRVEGSSTSSLAIGTGSKSFTIRSGSVVSTGWTNGETVSARVKYDSGVSMTGTVTSWNGTTLVLNISSTAGSGTYACWTFEMPATSTITMSGGSIAVTEDTTHSVEVSGLRILSGNPAISIADNNGKPVLIHNCRFSSNTHGVYSYSNRGVVWLCYFDQGFNWNNVTNNLVTSSAVAFKHGNATDASWSSAPTMGSADTNGNANFYVEDCFFTGHTTECCDFDDNSRTVWRDNVVDNSGLTSHGMDTSIAGNRHFEVYDNLCIFDEVGAATANMNYWVYWRGGAGIVTDNTMDAISSGEWGDKDEIKLTVQNLRRNAGANACWSSGWPCPRQVGQGHSGSAYQTEGAYIWNNSGSPVIAMEDYSPDECGGGPSVTTYIQLNRDYFTSAKSGYSKYTYPHPLRGGAMLGGPQNVRWRPA